MTNPVQARDTAPFQIMEHSVPTTGRGWGGIIAILLGVGAVLYVLLAVGCAIYLLWQAYDRPPGTTASDFEKLALGALIAMVGTGLTAIAAIYGATRQSATAYQVQLLSADASRILAHYNATISTQLAEMKNRADETLAKLKANSDEALARLKVGLDARQLAYRELFGVATIYFYGLRSIALGRWSDETIQVAETGMISATRHLLYVDRDMRNEWYNFWQRAQEICHEAVDEPDKKKRPDLVGLLVEKEVKVLQGNIDLRGLHDKLEATAHAAASTAIEG